MKFMKTRDGKTFTEWTAYWRDFDQDGGSSSVGPPTQTQIKNRATWMLCNAMEKLCHEFADDCWLNPEIDAVLASELRRQLKRVKEGFFAYHD
jgi:hypothetical protein